MLEDAGLVGIDGRANPNAYSLSTAALHDFLLEMTTTLQGPVVCATLCKQVPGLGDLFMRMKDEVPNFGRLGLR